MNVLARKDILVKTVKFHIVMESLVTRVMCVTALEHVLEKMSAIVI